MIITGGIAPNEEGGMVFRDENGDAVFTASKLSTDAEADGHKLITDAVHTADPDVKICMQILHMGPLAMNDQLVAPSAVRSRISKFTPNELDAEGIEKQIEDHVNCARLAQKLVMTASRLLAPPAILFPRFLSKRQICGRTSMAGRTKIACGLRLKSCAGAAPQWAKISSLFSVLPAWICWKAA